jgi:hypothetical protein
MLKKIRKWLHKFDRRAEAVSEARQYAREMNELGRPRLTREEEKEAERLYKLALREVGTSAKGLYE